MNRYPYMNCKIGKPAFWVFLLAMLLLARDTLITSVILGFHKSQFLMLGGMALVALGFLAVNRKFWKDILSDKRILLMAAFAAILVLPMLLKRDWQMMYFSIGLCALFPVFLTFFRTTEEVSRVYVVLLSALCAYSLLAMYVLKDLAVSGVLPVGQVENANDWPFYNFGLSYVVTWEYWNRNFGIFREPGVYQFFILLGLYLNNYHLDWKNPAGLWIVNGILAVTMLSTFAVGGFLELGLLAVFLFFDKKWYRSRWGKMAAAVIVAVICVFAVFFLWQIQQLHFERTIWYEIYDMCIRLFTDSESSSDRFSAIVTDVQFVFRNPLLGAGIAEVLHAVPNNTSSTLILYAILGVLGGSLNVLAWAALAWKKERCALGNLILLVILFLSFNTQNLTADLFFWLFPMMALTEKGMALFEKKV